MSVQTTAIPVQGNDAGGSAQSTNPLPMGGNDGSFMRTVATDNVGNQKVIGSAVDGAAKVGGAVRIGGSDGTNARDLFVSG